MPISMWTWILVSVQISSQGWSGSSSFSPYMLPFWGSPSAEQATNHLVGHTRSSQNGWGNHILLWTQDFLLLPFFSNNDPKVKHRRCFANVSWNLKAKERAVSGAFDGCVKIWDLRSGECLRTVQGHSRPIRTAPWAALWAAPATCDRRGLTTPHPESQDRSVYELLLCQFCVSSFPTPTPFQQRQAIGHSKHLPPSAYSLNFFSPKAYRTFQPSRHWKALQEHLLWLSAPYARFAICADRFFRESCW